MSKQFKEDTRRWMLYHKEGITDVEDPKDHVILVGTMKRKPGRAQCPKEQMLEREAREDYVGIQGGYKQSEISGEGGKQRWLSFQVRE